MIRDFPDFTPLDISHEGAIRDYLAQYEPYSDFNFISLFCWDVNNSTTVSLLNGNLVIHLPDYTTREPQLTMLGINNTDQSILQLLEFTNELKLVPQVTVDSIENPSLFHIEEDRDHFDYVYNTDEVAKLEGKTHKKKRNKVNSVVQAYGTNLDLKLHKDLDYQTSTEIADIVGKWAKHKKLIGTVPEKESFIERTAIERLLAHENRIDIYTTTAYVDGKMVAFSINELTSPDFAVCHFEKSLPIHPNMSSYIASAATQHLHKLGAKYVNWEQDLGIDGLRRSKEAFRPSRYLKKYRIRAKK